MRASDIFDGAAIGLAVEAPVARPNNQRDKEWEDYTCRIFALLGKSIAHIRRIEPKKSWEKKNEES